VTTPDFVAVGTELPEVVVPITRAFIVSTAIASRDYQDVHHDPDAARASGADDVFMNILTSNAMVERLVRGWAGPAARLTGVKVRLGVQNPAGDTLTLSGRVTAIAGDRAEVEVRGTNLHGVHISGSATLEWPEGGSA
jgi:hypothetical protein